MSLLKSLIVFIISILLSFSDLNYGKFDLIVHQFTPCKGPKQKDCSVVKAKLVDAAKVLYDMTLKQNMKPTKGKITASANGKQLLRLQANDPCDHLFLRPLFQSMLNVTESCVILKGHYLFQIDIGQVASNYYKGEFLYGNMTFKSMFFNEECNLSCAVVKVAFVPKTSRSNV